MTGNNDRHMSRRDWLAGSAMLIAGLAMSAAALRQIHSSQVVMAQAVETRPPVGRADGPADSMPGGVRPTTPAPEPARPESGGTVGVSPPATQDRPPVSGTPLPPAPAEQRGAPISPK